MALIGRSVTFTPVPNEQETRVEGRGTGWIGIVPEMIQGFRFILMSLVCPSLSVVSTEVMSRPNYWPSLWINEYRKTWQSGQEVTN